VSEPREVAIEGEVARVTFENRETGFRVVKVAVPGRADLVTLVGSFVPVSVGSRVRARGVLELDRNHGEQVRVTGVTELVPETLVGIEKYLGSGAIKGVGAVTAARIVEHFGLDTLQVLDANPERLHEVSGLGQTRARSIVGAWKEQRGLREVMIFLQSHGASPALASRIVKRFGAKAVAIVTANPYRLALDVWGVGFRTADRIAASVGVQRDSLERMQAALIQVLRDSTEQGHCYALREEVRERASRLLRARDHDRDHGGSDNQNAHNSAHERSALEDVECISLGLGQALAQLVREGLVVAERPGCLELAPVDSLDGAALYDATMHATELRVAERLASLVHQKPNCFRDGDANATQLKNATAAIAAFERDTATVLAPEQRAAIEQAFRSAVLVVTGGPGVGKTTLVRALVTAFEQSNRVTRLAAPTGRAAQRLSEATGREALTLHRLLEFDPKHGGFKRNAKSPLEAGALVVDETSMVDLAMADALLQAVADGTHLVLVGDVDQLPSVGAGAFLRDVIQSDVVPCVRLVRIFRQAETSLIVSNAHRINAGEMPVIAPPSESLSDFYVIEKSDPEEAKRVIVDLVTTRIPRRFGFDAVRDIQVLTPMNRGGAGALVLNSALQEAINPVGPGLARGRTVYRVGDKVMQLRNDYSRNVWNGDVGVVASIDEKENTLCVRFPDGGTGAEGRQVLYEASMLDDLTLAYATTIHKSQGSEYPAVVIPFLTAHFVMLTKNLLYTAVTRGKRLVVLVADPRAVRIALQPRPAGFVNDHDEQGRDGSSASASPDTRSPADRRRATKLVERLRHAYGAKTHA